MELWQRTREFGRGTEAPDGGIEKARGKLVAEIEGEYASGRVRSIPRPLWVAGSALAGVAALTVGVLFLAQNQHVPSRPEAVISPSPFHTQVPTPTPTPTSPPSSSPMNAQGALASAAAQIGAHAPVLTDGQYLRVDWHSELLWLGDGVLVGDPGWGVDHTTATRAWQIAHEGTTYIPADVRDDWYVTSGPMTAIATFGEDSGQDGLVAERLASVGEYGAWTEGGGVLPEGDGTLKGTMLTEVSADPDDILAWHRGQGGEGNSAGRRDVIVGWRLIHLLAANAGPSEIRAGMFLALSKLPDATVVDQTGTEYTVAFETGDFGMPGDFGIRRDTITFDAATGFVSAFSSRVHNDSGIVPDTVPDTSTTYRVSVVDGVPVP